MDRAVSPAMLPVSVLRLARRFWAPLLLWYVLGQLVHDLILRGAARVGSSGPSETLLTTEYTPWRVVGLAIMSMAVLVVLGAAILMLHAIAPGLPGLRVALRSRQDRAAETEEEPEGTSPVPGQRRMVDTVAETLLPFVVFYGAWGLFTSDVRQYAIVGVNTRGDLSLLDIPVNWLTLAVALGALGLRIVCEWQLGRTGNRVFALVTPVFEAIWMFFAVVTIGVLIGELLGWITSRAVWAGMGNVLGSLVDAGDVAVPFSSGGALRWLSSFGADVKDGLLEPLLWFTIAAVVYGEKMESDRRTVEGTRLERLHRARGVWARLPRRVQVLLDVASRELREKWTPAVNGLRLGLRAGATFFLAFCVCYVSLQVVTRWGWIGATRLIGPHPWEWWQVALVPLDFARDATFEVLRICLLGAAYDLALRRMASGGPPSALPATGAAVTART